MACPVGVPKQPCRGLESSKSPRLCVYLEFAGTLRGPELGRQDAPPGAETSI